MKKRIFAYAQLFFASPIEASLHWIRLIEKVLAAGAVLVAAAVSALVYVKNENNSMNEFFNANVEVLANNEGTPVKICYVERVEGPSEWAIFCTK